ncbi:hypothetical protein AQ490_27045 [Wenjunlia vitaminophila]|uniref:Glycosyl hydrolase family 98 putative carbohydrate-binding module domain-containing protein n=1 Tax=Wenjunlia vitaminophila TaxID=76728 RepID=A0A0T6LPV0_WENVI|nr:NPCBM/NEW2 domain-containing protein [Wenjunlia vitaminophila]KRV47992.1 hypothetical protein AQ490_27045 [Wenjunlia vitaminophila]
MTDLGGGRIRIDYGTTTAPSDNGLVYTMRQTTRDTAAGFVWESSDVTVRRIAARYLHGFGIVGQFSENITFDHNEFRTDPTTGRTTSAFADMIQLSGVRGKVTITNNVFDGPQDDPINIHGTYLQVTQRLAPDTLVLSYMHNETAGFPQYHPGDQVEFVEKRTMAAVAGGTATVLSVDGPSGQDHDKSLTTMTVTFDRPVPDVVTAGGYVAENTTYTPSARIAGNVFRNVPTRGILVTTRRPVVIENNVFDAMSMASVYISSDAYQWYESGPVRDVRIRHNTFLRPSGPVIFVDPTNQVLDPATPVHQGIHIEQNEFRIGNVELVSAKSVRGLTFVGNDVRRLDRDQLLAVRADDPCPTVGATTRLSAFAIKAPHSSSLFSLHGASDVLIRDNQYDNGLNLRADLDATQADQVTVEGDDIRFGQDNVLPVVQEPRFRSSEPRVLKVAPDGTATALAAGSAEVTAVVRTETGKLVSRPLTMTVGGDPASPACSRTTFVSDMPFTAESNGWGPVERDMSNGEQGGGDGNPLQIRGTRYDKGLGVHAPSSVSVLLDGRYERFVSQVGLDDEGGGNGSVAFEVVADGKVIATTPVMTGSDPARTIDVDVASVQELTLRVTDGGDGNSYDHADWADAHLVPTG